MDTAEEKWRPVFVPNKPELSKLYLVSDLGNVLRIGTNKKLVPYTNKKGYNRFCLSCKESHVFFAHRLVAFSFLKLENFEHTQINHKNGIKSDNRLVNLEWCTPSENTKHAYSVLGRKPVNGEMNGLSKLKESDIREIRAWCKTGDVSKRAIAEKWGVAASSITLISQRKVWAHVE